MLRMTAVFAELNLDRARRKEGRVIRGQVRQEKIVSEIATHNIWAPYSNSSENIQGIRKEKGEAVR
jgi:hypothetical protein